MGDDVVQLGPFVHQIGGHCGLYQFNDTTVCKPVTLREISFYKNIPETLKRFCPQYRGTIDVQCLEGAGGYVSIIAHPNSSMGTLVASSTPTAKLRVSIAGTLDLELQSMNPPTNGHTDKVLPNNPWSGHIHGRQMAKIKQEKQRCILLENLIHQYKCPCMLDLKMGIRNYGDYFSENKRLFQLKRSVTTTSASLGLRVCGSQVFDASTCSYSHINKCQGRTFDDDSARQCLRQFVQNGTQLRHDLICSIIRRLHVVYDTILNLPTVRLFGTSLLITYEGSAQPASNAHQKLPSCDSRPPPCDNHESERNSCNATPDLVDIRMIDFSKSTFRGFFDDSLVHEGPDDGYLFGLRNLMAILEAFLDEQDGGENKPEIRTRLYEQETHGVVIST